MWPKRKTWQSESTGMGVVRRPNGKAEKRKEVMDMREKSLFLGEQSEAANNRLLRAAGGKGVMR
jgi:hypothetical protein